MSSAAEIAALKPCPFCGDPMRRHELSGIIRHSPQIGEERQCPIIDHAFTDLGRWNTRAQENDDAQ